MVGAGDRASGAGGGAGGADGASTGGDLPGLPSQLPLVGGTAELPPSPAPTASTLPPTSNKTMKTTVEAQVCIQDLTIPHYNEVGGSFWMRHCSGQEK